MKVFSLIRNILFAAAVVIILFALACLLFRLKPAIIMSDSMNPTYSAASEYAKGGVAVIQRGGPYEEGKVIAFYNGSMFVMHRLVRIEEKDGVKMYITKGDSNEAEDTAMHLEKDLAGRVLFGIPLIGYVLQFAKTKRGLMIMGALLLCLILSTLMTDDEVTTCGQQIQSETEC